MALKDTHEKLEDIPEQFQELYIEKNGKWELTGIQGVKTQGDVDRINTSLTKERSDHKETKAKLAIWGDLDHGEVTSKLDSLPELEAAAKGKLDDAQIEEAVVRRVDGTIKSRLAGPERKIKELEKINGKLTEENTKFVAENRTRTIHDHVRTAMVGSKMILEAHEDALLLADRVFEISEEGKVVTRDSVGVTPGLDAAGWLTEMQDKRRHWWPESVGGGSKGSGAGVVGVGGKNPWSFENWNMTEQGRLYKAHGQERCEQLARAAGTTFGGKQPLQKKAAAV